MAYHQAEWPRNLRAGSPSETENFRNTGHDQADLADGGEAARCGEPAGGGTAYAGIFDA